MRKAAARIGLLTGATLLAGCTTAPADRPLPAPVDGLPSAPPATVACSPEGIRITGLGVSAAMGLRAMGLDLVNCGDRPYELRGYPAVVLRDADGDTIPVRIIPGAAPITSGFDDPPTRIVLAPGERAGAALIWRNLVTDATVVATAGTELDVAPSTGRPAYPVALDGPIDLGNTGRLGVSAWKRRDGAPATQVPPRSDPPAPSTSPVNPL
ncbi:MULTISPECIES: DUF4232 domain-containing protein [unclassified Micromonospora]|uniref:DUF4232 domain-containing protein n=1 Tax=unclassified Micromonospora TaxID=2617518 RepID=UPI001B38AFCD|nr:MULTISPECIES: DUF4232 domain-containing protein [unclassified Micromonospora]MBQ1042710.1 DUF4232 domain-containing protein [Micromonospora sp. C72]MBQ1054152.1 DUF4232 domain-containing protein [Micromonospora sp. C32]